MYNIDRKTTFIHNLPHVLDVTQQRLFLNANAASRYANQPDSPVTG